jgi:hypothetical protein
MMPEPTRPPQRVVACVLSLDASNAAWAHHNEPDHYEDAPAMAVADALWTDDQFRTAVLARAYQMIRPDEDEDYPLVHHVLRAVALELRAIVDAYPDALP